MENINNIAAVPVVKETVEEPQAAPIVQNGSTNAEQPKEEPFSLYQEINQVPYTVEYFGMNRSEYFALQQADITSLAPKIETIESYVREKILTENYKDSTQTYKEMLEEMSSQLGIRDYESAAGKIDKLFLFITRGKGLEDTYHVRRSNKADEMEHARYRAMERLRQDYPNKTAKLNPLLDKFFK